MISQTLLCLAAGLQLASAHMQMSWPIPFNSVYDTAAYPSPDYSMTSPLLADGSNYPCKGYQTQGHDKIQASYVPGGTYNMSLVGGANHNGGSCQLSLSYDNGATFRVIKSIIGNCPVTTTYHFTIPNDAPSASSALFAWTWFNYSGNREMYMNCARVAIGSGSQKRAKTANRMAAVKRQGSALSDLPENFACNINNGCTTVEGINVQFPNPGSVVEVDAGHPNQGTGPGYVLSGATPTGDAFVTSAAVSSAASDSTSTAISAQPSSLTAPSVSAGIFATASSIPTTFTSVQTPYANTTLTSNSTYSVAAASTLSVSPLPPLASTDSSTSTSAVTASTPATQVQPNACSPLGAIICDTETTWSMCNYGGPTFMGSTAAGMKCVNNAMVRA